MHLFSEMGFKVYAFHREQQHRPSCGCPDECYYGADFEPGEFLSTIQQAARPFKRFFLDLVEESDA